jgi:hypothetical protein
MEEIFTPPGWARNPHLQTIFGSLKLRAGGRNEMVEASREVIVDAGNGVRLLGYRAGQTQRPPKGLLILLHGWEGSSDSAYILSSGRYFFRRGFDVFRLNLRDHGHSHHLNRGLFHGALTEETFQAVRNISTLLPDGPCFLIGFSLGGNFALRIARQHATAPIDNLRQVFCVSPALDPYKATLAIDASLPVYRRYFLGKWKRSLRIKQRCFPDLYRFEGLLHHRTVMALTEAIMPCYTQYPTYRDYFRHYTLTGDALAGVRIPTTLFCAQDDPVVPAADFATLTRNGYLHVSLQKYGGHCGFLERFPFGSWYDRQIAQCLAQDEKG